MPTYPIEAADKTPRPVKDFRAGHWYECISASTTNFTKGYLYLACFVQGQIYLVTTSGGALSTEGLCSKFVEA